MPRDGSGNYSLPSGNPVVTGTTISSTTHNNTLSDIASALTASLTKDGQAVPTANLPMGTYKHTGVGDAAAATQYAAAGQVVNSALTYLGSVSGTNTITASATIAPSAYAAGQAFRFVVGTTNTGAVTLNVNSLGAKDVTKRGTRALQAGDLPAGAVAEVRYDGTRFQLADILRLNNYVATAAPGVGDDSDDGYSVGSQWYDVTNDTPYLCLDATVGAAVWRPVGGVTAATQATTSGRSVDFTIPAWATQVVVTFVGVSTNGNTDDLQINLGDAGGVETSGYLCTVSNNTGTATNFTNGFSVVTATAAASVYHGSVTLTRHGTDGLTWAAQGVIGLSNTGATHMLGGSKALSAALTTVRVRLTGSTNDFDAGAVGVWYT